MDEEGLWNDGRGFWSDEGDSDYSERRKKASHSRAQKKEGAVRPASRSKARSDVITSYNTTTRVSLLDMPLLFFMLELHMALLPFCRLRLAM